MIISPVIEIPQLEGESAPAYAARLAYLEMGGERSVAKVARKLSKSKTLINRWSGRYEWVDHARRYDEAWAAVAMMAQHEAERKEAEKWAARRQEQREREWDASQALLKKAQEMMKFPLATVEQKQADGKIINIIKPAGWSFATAAKVYESAAKLARLAAEMETERTAHNVTVEQLATMSLEELEELARKRGLPINAGDE